MDKKTKLARINNVDKSLLDIVEEIAKYVDKKDKQKEKQNGYTS